MKSNLSVCEPGVYYSCFHNHSDFYKLSPSVSSECAKMCPKQCTTCTYTLTSSSTSFSPQVINYMNESNSTQKVYYNLLNERSSLVYIYMDNVEYALIEQFSSITFTMLLSDLGNYGFSWSILSKLHFRRSIRIVAGHFTFFVYSIAYICHSIYNDYGKRAKWFFIANKCVKHTQLLMNALFIFNLFVLLWWRKNT